jgi:hypothetical protein
MHAQVQPMPPVEQHSLRLTPLLPLPPPLPPALSPLHASSVAAPAPCSISDNGQVSILVVRGTQMVQEVGLLPLQTCRVGRW